MLIDLDRFDLFKGTPVENKSSHDMAAEGPWFRAALSRIGGRTVAAG